MRAPVSNPDSPTSFQQDPSRRAPPYDQPGSLTPDQVYAVTAYLLHRHGIIGEQDVRARPKPGLTGHGHGVCQTRGPRAGHPRGPPGAPHLRSVLREQSTVWRDNG